MHDVALSTEAVIGVALIGYGMRPTPTIQNGEWMLSHVSRTTLIAIRPEKIIRYSSHCRYILHVCF